MSQKSVFTGEKEHAGAARWPMALERQNFKVEKIFVLGLKAKLIPFV
jgi:hypothetical protein